MKKHSSIQLVQTRVHLKSKPIVEYYTRQKVTIPYTQPLGGLNVYLLLR